MNSALQCLSNLGFFTQFAKDFKNEINRMSSETGEEYLFGLYCILIDEIWSGRSNKIEPVSFRSKVRQLFPQFNNYNQNDCSEFLTNILNQFHEELKRIQFVPDNNFDDYKTFEEYLRYNDTVIARNFKGFQKYQLKCECGHTITESYDPFYIITLPRIEETQNNVYNISINFIPEHSDIIKVEMCFTQNEVSIEFLLNQFLVVFKNRTNFDIQLDNLITAEIVDSNIVKVFNVRDIISLRDYPETIFIYQTLWYLEKQIFIVLKYFDHSFGYPIVVKEMRTNYYSFLLYFKMAMCKLIKLDPNIVYQLLNGVTFIGQSENGIQFEFNEHNFHLPINQRTIVLSVELPLDIRIKYDNLKFYYWSYTDPFGAISRRNCVNLEMCIQKYIDIKTFDQGHLFYCNDCQREVNVKEKIDILYAPNVLILQLKTDPQIMDFFDSYQCNYDLTLDMKPFIQTNDEYIYDLVSVSKIVRYGSVGHYTTVAKNFRNCDWYEFNDDLVTKVCDRNKVISKDAYLLFYMKR